VSDFAAAISVSKLFPCEQVCFHWPHLDNEFPPLRWVSADLLKRNDLRSQPHTLRVLFSRVFMAAVGSSAMK
jgi:hypothetical protein